MTNPYVSVPHCAGTTAVLALLLVFSCLVPSTVCILSADSVHRSAALGEHKEVPVCIHDDIEAAIAQGSEPISFLAHTDEATELEEPHRSSQTSVPGVRQSVHQQQHTLPSIMRFGGKDGDAKASNEDSTQSSPPLDGNNTTEIMQQPLMASTRANVWGPIRIGFSSLDLEDGSKFCARAGQQVSDFRGRTITCTEADILTADKKRLLLNVVVPAAARMHQDRLTTIRLNSIGMVSENMAQVPICNRFTYPQSHVTVGVSNTEFVMYLAAAPTPEGVIAWASPCLVDATLGRPTFGVMNISPRYINSVDGTVRTVAHEMMHALGFSSRFFRMKANMVSTVTQVRGVQGNFPAITSPQVLSRVRMHHGCSTLLGYELENTGGDLTASSHWKMRNAKDELMAPYSGAMRYTALSIAMMEDLGFFRGIYTAAEDMAYARNVGCAFFTDKCVINGATPFPNAFCTERQGNVPLCVSTRLAVGICGIGTIDPNAYGISRLPLWAQYFGSATYGGGMPAMDFCPFVQPLAQGSCGSSDAGGPTGSDPQQMPGSVISPASRCLSVADTSRAIVFSGKTTKGICVDVKCDTNARSYQIRFRGAQGFVDCPVGATLTPVGGEGSGGFTGDSAPVECAAFEDVCIGNTIQVFGSPDAENSADGLKARGDGTFAPAGARPFMLLVIAVLSLMPLCFV